MVMVYAKINKHNSSCQRELCEITYVTFMSFNFKSYSNKNRYQFTSAAGFPPTETHSRSISWSSTAWSTGLWSILGGSGGTRTVSLAYLDLIGGSPNKK